MEDTECQCKKTVAEVHREVVYAMGLVSNLREHIEDAGTGDIRTLAQVDAVKDKLKSILQILE